MELIKSKDGQIRGAKVKIGNSGNMIERPLNKLYPVEIKNNRDDHNKSLYMNIN